MKPMLSVLMLIIVFTSCQKDLSVDNSQRIQVVSPVVKKDTVNLKISAGINIVPTPGDTLGSSSGTYAVVVYDDKTLPIDVYVTLMWDETDLNGKEQRKDLKYIVTLTVDKQAVSAYTGIVTTKTHKVKNMRITEIKSVKDSNYYFKW